MNDGIFRAIGYLIGAVFLYYAYVISREYGEKSTNLVKTILSALFSVVIVAALISSSLGSHTENCEDDPIRGQCETVQDYQPTDKQYQESFWFWLLVIGGPICIGIYKGKKNKDNDIDDGAKLDTDKAREIIGDYGKVIETVSEEMLIKYPTLRYPISLLPCSRPKIERAGYQVINYFEDLDDNMKELKVESDNSAYINSIKTCLVMLQRFIPDRVANEENNKMLNNLDWQEAVKNNKKLKKRTVNNHQLKK